MNKEAIKDFNKVINALALELPEEVWNDVNFRWIQFQNAQPESESPLSKKEDKITRLEIINHAKNDKPVGRLLTLYKETNDFSSLEFSYQDGGRTLKIFLD